MNRMETLSDIIFAVPLMVWQFVAIRYKCDRIEMPVGSGRCHDSCAATLLKKTNGLSLISGTVQPHRDTTQWPIDTLIEA